MFKFKNLVSLFILSSILLSGCGNSEASVSEESKDISEIVSEATSEEASESANPEFVFDTPTKSGTDLSKKEYTAVKDLPAESKAQGVKSAKKGYTYFDASTGIFELTGIVAPKDNDGEFARLPMEDITAYPSDNMKLAGMLAGGRLRFVTNAESFVLYADMGLVYKLSYFCAKGAYGFDVYTGTGTSRKYIGASGNHLTHETNVHSIVDLGKGYKEVTIILPAYGEVNNLYIGLPDDSSVATPDKYTYEKPVLFYGSSITQGASVTRPGLSYANIVTLALDANCYNLGFSGSAKGEKSVAEYIASLDISAFVMDYDYNAPDVEHLKKTHYDFYKAVRDAHPDIPIILMSHPYYTTATKDDADRVAVVKATYEKAVSDGDENIYFIDSEAFFPVEYRDLVTVDNTHPNDIGHLLMAEALYPVLKASLAKQASQ